MICNGMPSCTDKISTSSVAKTAPNNFRRWMMWPLRGANLHLTKMNRTLIWPSLTVYTYAAFDFSEASDNIWTLVVWAELKEVLDIIQGMAISLRQWIDENHWLLTGNSSPQSKPFGVFFGEVFYRWWNLTDRIGCGQLRAERNVLRAYLH